MYLLWQAEPLGEFLLGIYSSLARARHARAILSEHQAVGEQLAKYRITACRINADPEAAEARRVLYQHPFVNFVDTSDAPEAVDHTDGGALRPVSERLKVDTSPLPGEHRARSDAPPLTWVDLLEFRLALIEPDWTDEITD